MKNDKEKRVYLAVDLTECELPIAIFLTIKEGANWCGCSREDFCKKVKRGDIDYKNKCKYIKVNIDDDEQKYE